MPIGSFNKYTDTINNYSNTIYNMP